MVFGGMEDAFCTRKRHLAIEMAPPAADRLEPAAPGIASAVAGDDHEHRQYSRRVILIGNEAASAVQSDESPHGVQLCPVSCAAQSERSWTATSTDRRCRTRSSGEFNRLKDRRIVILRLIDPLRDRPHPHWLRRKRGQEIVRVRIGAEPPLIVLWEKIRS